MITTTSPGPAFAPLDGRDRYPPLEDLGLIGDGTTAALVDRRGTVVWLCAPRFDSEPFFCSLLDARRGGSFGIAPTDVEEARQRYEPDTPVLVTELRGPSGAVRITDCLTVHRGAALGEAAPAGRGELLRLVEGLEGEVALRMVLDPTDVARATPDTEGVTIGGGAVEMHLSADVPIDGLETTFGLGAGDRASFVLSWAPGTLRPELPGDLLDSTLDAWRRWVRCFDYHGPRADEVRRSVITLKALDYLPTGALVAAPTSSLPEAIGGVRNWDYRFSWVRDAAYSVYALRRVGLGSEANSFLRWVLEALERDGEPRVLYTLDGTAPPPERTDPDLEGYRQSAPVRWGNGAARQRQHDVYGEILDCAYQWVAHGGTLAAPLWAQLVQLVEDARERWDEPDHGIWEVRTVGRSFTYSAAMCQVALDRGARLAERLGLEGDVEGWRRDAARIRDAIIDRAWVESEQSFAEHLGGGGLDASLLALPLRRVVDARHPRMVATVEAIRERLGAGDGLLYRYLPDESPDGLVGHEGAFLLCSFWLVDNLAAQGRVEGAMELYESLCDRANPLGLLPEQIDPPTGAFLGNYPQAFSHVGLVSSGINLGRITETSR